MMDGSFLKVLQEMMVGSFLKDITQLYMGGGRLTRNDGWLISSKFYGGRNDGWLISAHNNWLHNKR